MFAGLGAQTALAGSFEITPVLHELPADARALSFTVANRSAASSTVQVRGFRWTQPDGEDRLDAEPQLVFSPVIFTLAPGAQQVVRGVFVDGAAAHERSYRILVDELPSADAPQPLRFALRVSVPVFRVGAVASPRASATAAQADASPLAFELSADGRRLVVRNPGARTERVRDLAVTDADGRVVERARTASPYLLPGAWRAWPLEPADATAPTGDASVARGDSPSGARRTIDPQALRFVTATTDAGGLRVALPRAP